MTRYWMTPLVALALLAGGAAAAGSASASTAVMNHHHTVAAKHRVRPGDPMIWPGGVRGSGKSTAQSTNWSGYAVTGKKFTSVSASWTEPTAKCNGTKYAAFWVGLDGYSSNSVEQTGTDSDCSGSTPHYYGWYEMFPAFPVNFSNPVHAGDHFTASVTFSGTDTYTLVLKDVTAGWTKTIKKSQSGLARSSAEVITEAPSSGTGVLPLADFGTVHYTAATANGTLMSSQGPVKIIMVNSSGADKDSTSTITSAGAFSNTWLRSN
jgi:hypothetical protein